MGKNSKYYSLAASSVMILSLITTPLAGVVNAEETDGTTENQTATYTAVQATAIINLLSSTSPTYVDEVDEAAGIYDELSEDEKKLVTATTVTKLTNHTTAVTVIKQIDSLPTVEAITAAADSDALTELKTPITGARSAYTALTTTAKGYVKNLAVLTAAEAAVKKKEGEFTNLAILTPWLNAVAALPPLIDLSEVTVEAFMAEDAQKYSSDELGAITTARTEYSKLATTPKSYVKAEDLSKLTALEADVKRQATLEANVVTKKLADFTASVNGIVLTSEKLVEEINTMLDAYSKLEDNVSAKVTNATKAKIVDYEKVALAVEAINNAGEIAAIEATTTLDELATLTEPVTKARATYNGLTATQKSYVKFLSKLTALESAITKQKVAINNAEALTAWNEAYGALPEVKDLTELTVELFAEKGYQEEDIKKITAARTEYNKLTTTLKSAVSATALSKLTTLEAGVKEQAAIKADYDQKQKEAQELADEVSTWTQLVTDLGAVKVFTNLEAFKLLDESGKYSTEEQGAIVNVRVKYDLLTANAKANETVIEAEKTVVKHEESVVKQGELQLELEKELEEALATKINDVIAAVDAIVTTDKTYAEYADLVKAATDKFAELTTEAEKAAVPTAIQTKYDNHIAAEKVAKKISEAGTVDAIEAAADLEALATLTTPVTTAREAYTALTATQKNYVVNKTQLESLEQAIVDRKAEINAAAEVKAFKDAVTALGAVKTFDGLDYKTSVEDATKYDDDAIAAIKAARKLYEDFTTAAKAIFDEENAALAEGVDSPLDILENHEAALEAQEDLLKEIADYTAVKSQVKDFEDSLAALAGIDVLTFGDKIITAKDVEEDPDLTVTVFYSSDEEEAITTASTALTELKKALTKDDVLNTELLNKYTTADNRKVVEDLVTALGNQNTLLQTTSEGQINTVKSAIEALTAPVNETEESLKAVSDAKDAFDELSGDQQNKIAADLKTKLTNYVAAAEVGELIAAITEERIAAAVFEADADPDDADAVTIEMLEAEVGTATSKHAALSSAQKQLLKDVTTTLASLSSAIADKKFDLEAAVELADWLEALAKVEGFTEISYSEETFLAKEGDDKSPEHDAANVALIGKALEELEKIDSKYASKVVEEDATFVRNLDKNTKEFDRLKGLQEAAITEALATWTGALAAIKEIDVLEFTSTDDPYYTSEQLEAIEDAREAYDNLAKPEAKQGKAILTLVALQAEVSGDDVKVLTDLEDSLDAYQDVVDAEIADANADIAAFKEVINDIGTTIADYSSQVTAAKTAYGDLSPKVKEYFAKEYEADFATYTNHVAAEAVVVAIQALGTKADVEAIATQSAYNVLAPKVAAVNTKYEALTDDQEAIVEGLLPGTLEELNNALEAKKTELDNKAKIAAWTTAFGKLPETVLTFNGVTAENFATSDKYTAQELKDIEAARTVLTNYETNDTAAKALVSQTEIDHLVALEASAKKQEDLVKAVGDAAAEAIIAAELEPWNAMGATFPNLIGFEEDMTKEEFEALDKYDATLATLLENARTLFDDGLSADAKAKTNDDALKALEEDFALQNKLKAAFDKEQATQNEVDAYKAFLEALGAVNVSEETFVDNVATMKDLYDNLSDANKAKVSNANKSKVTDYVAAAAVVKEINKVTDLTRIEAATTVATLTNITIEIEVARINYTNLTATQRSMVKNYAKIAAANATVQAKRTALQNAAAITTWTNAYKELPTLLNLDSVTYTNVANFAWYNTAELGKITALENIYKGYTDAVKALVPQEEVDRLNAYLELVKEYKKLKDLSAGAAAATATLQNWNTALGKLAATAIDVEGLTADTYASWTKYNAEELAAIKAATTELNEKLSEEAKKYITKAELDKYDAHVAAAKALEAARVAAEDKASLKSVSDVINAINALSKTSATYVADTNTANSQYEALTPVAKAKIAASVVTKLNNHVAAVEVIEAITALPAPATIEAITTLVELETQNTPVKEARLAYAALNTTEKGYVTNLATLTAIEGAVKTKQTALQNATALSAWETAKGNLPPLTTLVSTMTVDEYKAADKYDGSELTAITTARTEYNRLTTTLKNLVSATDLKLLTDAEAQVKIQTALDTKVLKAEAADFTTQVNAIKPAEVDTFVAKVGEVETKFGILDPEVAKLLTNATKAKVTDYVATAAVVDLIAKLDSTDPAFKADVTAARAAYNKLTATQKSYVKNLTTLTAQEKLAKSMN